MSDPLLDVLRAAGVPNPAQELRWLREAAPDDETVSALVARRAAGEPLQYLTGVAGFRYLELEVGPGVLIPRPETEVVTEHALARLPIDGVLVDVGTGSGAIALAVASERPDAGVHATDISPEALAWARRNRDRLGLEVTLVQGDLFAGLPSHLRGAVDVVVSNPPYVAQHESELLPPEVRDHEPGVALFSPNDGMEVTRRLAAEAKVWLRVGGALVLEAAAERAAEVARLLPASGYGAVEIHDDLAGRPRVVTART